MIDTSTENTGKNDDAALPLPALDIEAVGLDVSLGAVQGAQENAESEGASDICTFMKCDAKAMRAQLNDGSFDAIVTNVPWGVQ